MRSVDRSASRRTVPPRVRARMKLASGTQSRAMTAAGFFGCLGLENDRTVLKAVNGRQYGVTAESTPGLRRTYRDTADAVGQVAKLLTPPASLPSNTVELLPSGDRIEYEVTNEQSRVGVMFQPEPGAYLLSALEYGISTYTMVLGKLGHEGAEKRLRTALVGASCLQELTGMMTTDLGSTEEATEFFQSALDASFSCVDDMVEDMDLGWILDGVVQPIAWAVSGVKTAIMGFVAAGDTLLDVDGYQVIATDIATLPETGQGETSTRSPGVSTIAPFPVPENASSLGPIFVDRPYASSKPEARGIYTTGPTTFVSTAGSFEVSAAQWFSGEDIEFEGYSVGGPDNQPFVVGVIVVREPAVDLDPEFFETMVVKVDLRGELVAKTSVNKSDQAYTPNEVVGTTGSDAVLFSKYHDNGDATYAYDADSGALLWEKPGSILAGTREMVVIHEGVGEYCSVAHGVDNVSGTVRFSLKPERYDTDCLGIDALWHIGNATVLTQTAVGQRYFNLALEDLGPYASGDLPNQVFDSRTGEAAQLPDTISFVDPLSNLVVNTPATFLARDADDSKLIVTDTSSGKEVFSLAGRRVQALSAEPLFLLDSRLYVQTTDAVLVVDCNSGEVVDRNISAYPVDFAGGIVKMSDGTTSAASSL